jgi:hypothetical protein
MAAATVTSPAEAVASETAAGAASAARASGPPNDAMATAPKAHGPIPVRSGGAS